MSVRNALLGLLIDQPRYGYELHAAFEALVGGRENWEINIGQIYMTLGRLEKSGLIAPEGATNGEEPGKQVYSLTEAGRQELIEWLTAPVIVQHQRDEFYLKLMISLATGVTDPYQMLYTQRTTLYRELHEITERRSEANPQIELAYIFLLDRSIMYFEADLRWLDMVEARLDEIRRQPVPKPGLRPRGRPAKDKHT